MKKIIKWYDHRTYPTNPIIDAYLLNGLNSGIKELIYYNTENTWALCKFNNGLAYKFWNANIPYAWLSEGIFAESDDEILFRYNGCMPSCKVMNKFYDAMYKFLLNRDKYGEG